jgi:hypothetical protein
MHPIAKTLSLFATTMFAVLWMASCGETEPADVDEQFAPSGKVSVQASASPSTASAGQEVLLRLTVTATRSVTADVDLTVLDPDGTQRYTASFAGQRFTANTPKVLEESFVVEAGDAAGTYQIGAQLVRSGTTSVLFDRSQLATLTVTGTTTSDSTPPSVPTGLSSSNVTSTGMTLSWSPSTDNVGVTGYEVFRNGTSIGTTATTSIGVTGLSAGTTYSMTVRARDAAGNGSSPSAALSVTTSTGSSTPTPAGFPTRTSVGPAVEPTVVWTGGCYITQSNLVIENRIINCFNEGLHIARGTTGVVIRNSVVNGGIMTGFTPGDAESEDNNYPIVFTVESSRIVQESTTSLDRGVCCSHFVVKNSLIQGSHSGLWGFNKATLEGNYITTDGTDTHQSGLRMLKNSTLRGNTVVCKPVTAGYDGGCSAAAVFYREFGVPGNLNIENNYFHRDPFGGPYFATRFIDCQNTNDCVNIKFTGNLFDRGWGTDGGEFPDDAGDVWSDNWWTDGVPALVDQSR